MMCLEFDRNVRSCGTRKDEQEGTEADYRKYEGIEWTRKQPKSQGDSPATFFHDEGVSVNTAILAGNA